MKTIKPPADGQRRRVARWYEAPRALCVTQSKSAWRLMTRRNLANVARTFLGELGSNPGALEPQLSHKEPGIVGVYNKAQHLPERRKVMQAWADYLDSLKASGNVASVTHAVL